MDFSEVENIQVTNLNSADDDREAMLKYALAQSSNLKTLSLQQRASILWRRCFEVFDCRQGKRPLNNLNVSLNADD